MVAKKAYFDDFHPQNKKKQKTAEISLEFFVGLWKKIFIPILAQTPGNKQNKTYIHRAYSLAKAKQKESNNNNML